jgi:hypothetical protein
MARITENTIESFAIGLLDKLGYEDFVAPEIMSSKTNFFASGGGLAGKWSGFQKSAISAMPMAPHIVVAGQLTAITADGQVFYSKNQQITYLCNIKTIP